ncbi:alpha-amylase family protein [Actinomyces gaoshouyii]|uniref:alpha-amylase family protein n=1 Tax=Actinomyces gaoshouyii TaxID=1960083 RepID=UPI0009B5197B|nr:alpha-amylase family protein [Actinomyces gaoshouyii]
MSPDQLGTSPSSRGPAWVDHAIWWQIYPLGATGAPIRPAAGEGASPGEAPSAPDPEAPARLDRLEPWLDYAVELGVNGLSLGPIFRSATHGYDTTDHFAIDPRLGDAAAFDRLAEACRRRGLALMLDGVFNHVGYDHPLFQAALAGGAERELFRFAESAGADDSYAVFEGHGSLPILNHDSPETARLVGDVMNHWLDRGATAWRLDAAYAVPPAFWARVLPAVRERHPSAWFMAEVIHGDYAGIVEASGVDSLTQYELWKAVWSSLNDANFFELDWCLKRHNEFMGAFLPATFVGNHDVTRIASRVGPSKAALAVVILMTVGGVPSIYYGDEQAFTGVKRDEIGGDDEIRPPLPTAPEGLSPLGAPMLRLHQDLIGLRRRHPWLVRARTEIAGLTDEHLRYDAVGEQGERLRVELDLVPAPRAVVIAPGEAPLVIEPPR